MAIDYNALAQKFGGTTTPAPAAANQASGKPAFPAANSSSPVDYTALTNEFGGTTQPGSTTQSSQNSSPPFPPAPSSQSNTQANPLDQPGIMKTGADFMTGVGKGIASTVKGAANLGEKYLLNPISNAMGDESAIDKVTGEKPGQTAANSLIPNSVTTPNNTTQSIGKGTEQIGEFLLPGGAAGDIGKAAEGAEALSETPKLAKFAGFASKLASEGLIGAGQQSTQQGSTDNFLGNAMLFGSMSGAGEALGKAGSYATKEFPARLVDSALKPSVQELEKAIKYGGDTLGSQVVEKGMVGNDKGLYKQAMININSSENKLQSVLADNKETINKGDFYKYLSPQIDKLSKTPGMEKEFNHVVEVFSQLPKEMSLPEANVIKRNLYGALQDKSFALDPNLSAKKEAMKAVAKGIKTEIEEKTAGTAGEGVVHSINQDLSTNGKIADRTLNNMAKEEKKNILPSLVSHAGYAGAGGLAGYKQGGITGALAGAGLGLAGEGILGSTLGKTTAAKLLTKTGEVADALPTTAIGKITKAAVVKGVRGK